MISKALSRLDHVGVIVRDLDNTIRYYESLGIGPFEEKPRDFMDALTVQDMYGKPVDSKLRIANANLGGVFLEVIQPVKDAFMEDFLKKRGEGIQHLAFRVENVPEEAARLTKKGYKIVVSASHPSGGRGIFLDTSKVGGVIIELVRR